jgi:hypothetical protein
MRASALQARMQETQGEPERIDATTEIIAVQAVNADGMPLAARTMNEPLSVVSDTRRVLVRRIHAAKMPQ